MAVGYKDRGVDLENRFESRQVGDPLASLTGYRTPDNTDINGDFLPLSAGSPLGFNVGYAVNGTDLSQIFAAKGTGIQLSAPWADRTNTVRATCSNISGFCSATSTWNLRFNADGRVEISTTESIGGSKNYNSIGNWIDASSITASDFEVRVQGGGIIRNDYNTWQNVATSRILESQNTVAAPPNDTVTTPGFEIFIELRERSNTSNIVSGTIVVNHQTTNNSLE